MERGLSELRVVDLSTGIAGAYVTKLFADAGADVVKVEPAGGDPLRAWTASGVAIGEEGGALFRFLAGSKRSVLAAPGDAELEALLDSADLVVESFGPAGPLDRAGLLAARARPGAALDLALRPRGAPCGAGPVKRAHAPGRVRLDLGARAEGPGALPGRRAHHRVDRGCLRRGGPPWPQCGARSARATGSTSTSRSTRVMAYGTTNFMDTMWGLLGRPPVAGSVQSTETPSIEPTSDGFVGFNTNSAQQISDFLLLIGRPDLRETGEFDLAGQRS